MDIYMIWVMDSTTGEKSLIDAWDGDSIAMNGAGWKDRVAEARAEHGADFVAVIRTSVDFTAVEQAFQPPFAKTTGDEKVEV